MPTMGEISFANCFSIIFHLLNEEDENLEEWIKSLETNIEHTIYQKI